MPHHHHHVTTSAPTQFEDKFDAFMRAITNSQFDDIIRAYKITEHTQLDTFNKIIAKLDNYTNTATDNIAGDDRLLDDNG
jgi:hypothetical protein